MVLPLQPRQVHAGLGGDTVQPGGMGPPPDHGDAQRGLFGAPGGGIARPRPAEASKAASSGFQNMSTEIAAFPFIRAIIRMESVL